MRTVEGQAVFLGQIQSLKLKSALRIIPGLKIYRRVGDAQISERCSVDVGGGNLGWSWRCGGWPSRTIVTVRSNRTIRTETDRRNGIAHINHVRNIITGCDTVPIMTLHIRVHHADPAKRTVTSKINEDCLAGWRRRRSGRPR